MGSPHGAGHGHLTLGLLGSVAQQQWQRPTAAVVTRGREAAGRWRPSTASMSGGGGGGTTTLHPSTGALPQGLPHYVEPPRLPPGLASRTRPASASWAPAITPTTPITPPRHLSPLPRRGSGSGAIGGEERSSPPSRLKPTSLGGAGGAEAPPASASTSALRGREARAAALGTIR
jgi:hypothetical protein